MESFGFLMSRQNKIAINYLLARNLLLNTKQMKERLGFIDKKLLQDMGLQLQKVAGFIFAPQSDSFENQVFAIQYYLFSAWLCLCDNLPQFYKLFNRFICKCIVDLLLAASVAHGVAFAKFTGFLHDNLGSVIIAQENYFRVLCHNLLIFCGAANPYVKSYFSVEDFE